MSISTSLRLPASDLDHIFDVVGVEGWEQLRGKSLLLTGGTGFIGKWLLGSFLHANRRLALEAKVVVVSRHPEAFLKEYPELRNLVDINWQNSDVRSLVPKTIADCSFAIHAATDVVSKCSSLETLDTCISGTRRVIEAISAASKPCRMLLLSSGAVYGRPPSGVAAISEDWIGAPDPLMPASAYGEGKRVSELLCSIAAGEDGGCLDIAIARCFAFVGPHLPLNKQFAIGNFIGAALRGDDIHIQGDGTPLRSYLYAADLTHWLWVMLFNAKSSAVYNIGGVEAISIGDLARRVNHVLGGSGKVRVAQAPRPGDVPHVYVPSVQRIHAELGLVPSVNLDEAIIRTARWVNNYHGT